MEVSKMIRARSGEERWSVKGTVARRGVWRWSDETDGGKKLENRVQDQRPGGAINWGRGGQRGAVLVK